MTRPHPALLDLAAGRTISSVGDPDVLVASAAEHGMAGLLWTRVRDGEVEVPRDHALQLAATDVQQRDHNLHLAATIERAVAVLETAGIPSATFRGVYVERRWYERVGERRCHDIDLLLSPDVAGRIAAALEALDPRG